MLGLVKERNKSLAQDADIYVINRENVQWLCENRRNSWPFDMVVIDELSSFKNPSAKRFKALRKMLPYTHRVVGLTGTPATNGYVDLWSEVYLLDRGTRLGASIGLYRRTYFTPAKYKGHIVYEWRLNDGAKDMIDKKLSDLCTSMKAVDLLDMPERVDTDIYVSMTPAERKLYDKFGRDHVLPKEGIVGRTSAIVQGKLLQMANGFAYDEDGNSVHFHDHKLEALGELIEAANDRPVLVYYSYTADRDRIIEMFKDARVLKGANEVRDWNAGKIPILVAHPASAGHGLNLQAGGNIIVWFGLPWSLELYQQANARLYRQGQQNTVYVYHILTHDTHDVDVLKALEDKNTTQEALLSALKARIKSWAG